MSCVWLALVRALKVRKTGTISAGRPFVSCCVMFRVLPAERSVWLKYSWAGLSEAVLAHMDGQHGQCTLYIGAVCLSDCTFVQQDMIVKAGEPGQVCCSYVRTCLPCQ